MTKQKLLFSEKQIQEKVLQLGQTITDDYQGKDLVVIGVLNGAFIFVADLIRCIGIPHGVDFIRVSSYGDKTTSCGNCRITKDVELSLQGKDVLLVEDIVDTGITLKFLQKKLSDYGTASVRTCTLINKTERRQKSPIMDYIGFTVSDGFLVGYGLDCAEQYRHLPVIYTLLA